MVDSVMLLVALLAFAALVVGWMILPDASQAVADSQAGWPAATSP